MRFHRLAALLLALLLLLPAAAFAAEGEEPSFADRDWDGIVAEFLARQGADPASVGIAYYNTVTGEEHLLNGDRYFYAASLYKLPLNMYYAQKVAAGEMTMDEPIGGFSYEVLMKASLEQSNNDYSHILMEHIGTHEEYVQAVRPILAEPDWDYDTRYTMYNEFTPAQYLHALRLLYGAPERFPRVEEHMRNAYPDGFFRMKEQRFAIAHKYGIYTDEGYGAVNDCAIVYTDEPILLVMMTDHAAGGVGLLADFCVLMCDYSQYWAGVHAAEAAAEAEARAKAEAEAAAQAEARSKAEAEAKARSEAEALAKAQAEAAAKAEAEAAEKARAEAEAEARHAADMAQKARRTRLILIGAAAAAAVVAAIALLLGKKKKKTGAHMLVLALCVGLCLSAAGCTTRGETAAPTPAPTAAPTPAPTPEPTPAPTPEPTPEPLRSVTLTDEGPEEILALLHAPELRYVDAGGSTEYAALARLASEKPECVVDYAVDLGGVTVRSTEETAVLDGAETDFDTLAQRLAWLPKLRALDIRALSPTNEQALALADAFPDIDFLWMVHFGRWTVRSDITCFSTLQSWPVGYRYTDADLAPLLRGCRHLRALDLGHNALTDLTPIGALTELQVLILGDNPDLTDISPLGNLTELRYMEFFMADRVRDYSCMAKLTNMRDLCMGYCNGLDDISFVSEMPALEMGWFPGDPLSEQQRADAQAARPDTTFLFVPSRTSSTSDGWRATERNVEIRRAFSNWDKVAQFRAWDDVDYIPGAALNPVYPIDN